jgi:outer membrane lipoprotein SlyB
MSNRPFHAPRSRLRAGVAAAALSLLLGACAAPPPQPVEIRRGVIEQIVPTQITSNHHQGVGAVLGGLTGVGIGSLIGGGTGRDVAMIAGAIGGALAGNEIQKREQQPIPAQQIIVRTTSGVLVVVTQPDGPRLYVGQKVYLQGSGEQARVTPE